MEYYKFKGHERAQAHITVYPNGNVVLFSYDTKVAYYEEGNGLVIIALCSATTRKHIGQFMRLFGVTYQEAKKNFFKLRYTQPTHNIDMTQLTKMKW